MCGHGSPRLGQISGEGIEASASFLSHSSAAVCFYGIPIALCELQVDALRPSRSFEGPTCGACDSCDHVQRLACSQHDGNLGCPSLCPRCRPSGCDGFALALLMQAGTSRTPGTRLAVGRAQAPGVHWRAEWQGHTGVP